MKRFAALCVTVALAGGAGGTVVGQDAGPELAMLPPEIPDSVRSGTLATPLGQARWVHLVGDDTTLPSQIDPISDPSGGYMTLGWGGPQLELWRSPDLIEWTREAMPVEAEYGDLSQADGTIWLSTEEPPSLWRSSDAWEWNEVGLDGLTPPGPAAVHWRAYLRQPQAFDGVTLVPLSYSPELSGAILGLTAPDLSWASLREIEPGVYEVSGFPWGQVIAATVRIEDTGSGVQVIDDEDGDVLKVLDGVNSEFFERWASGDLYYGVHRLGMLSEDELVDVELPSRMAEASGSVLSVDESGFLAYSIGPDRWLHIHRSEDGREWTETDVVGDDPGEPTDIEQIFTEAGSVTILARQVTNELPGWTTTDGMTWEPWCDPQEAMAVFDFADGCLRIMSFPISDPIWYTPRGGEPVAIEVGDSIIGDAGHLPAPTGRGYGVSSNSLFISQSRDSSGGDGRRDSWIITFDEL